MAANTRFATGVHTLVLLAAEPGILQTSEEIAEKLNTNPVVIRRVLSLLRQSGLVVSQKGPSGGSRLAKPARAIRLGDIFRSVEPMSIFHGSAVTSEYSGKVGSILDKVFRQAQSALETELDATTLAQVAKKAERKKNLAAK